MSKVFLFEEVKPHPKPAEQRLYNSPPSFGGRYLLTNPHSRPIGSNEFSVLKENNWISYWSSEYLEDVDMFFEQPGWRLTAEGIEYLKKRGYDIEVNTIEQQKEREEKAKQELIKQQQKEAEEAEERNKKLKEFSVQFQGLTFHERFDVEEFKDKDYLANGSIKFHLGKGYDQYTEFGLTPDDRVYKFEHYNYDFWRGYCSNERAPEEFMKIIHELREKTKKDQEDREAKRIHELKTTNLYEFKCGKCDRIVYLSENKKNEKREQFCKNHGTKRDLDKLRRMNAIMKFTGNTMTWFDALEQKKELSIY